MIDTEKMPRIRGRVGTIEDADDKSMIGKYVAELFVAKFGDGIGQSVGEWGPFDTKAQAMARLREASEIACKEIERMATGKVTGQYIDMKTNEIRKWGDEN